MWGEFEDDDQDKRANYKAQSTETPGITQETSLDTTAEEDDIYTLPLRDRLVHCIAASNVQVKSQQKYEPDLTYDERKDIIDKLLQDKPGQFLYRFGSHLEREHLQYFLEYEGNAEVDHFLAEALKNKNKHTAKIAVRNRRYAALQKMQRSGDYFSEQEMERRDPLLYDHLIGQHLTQEEKEERQNASTTSEIKFSSLLLHHIDNCAHKELKKQQEDQEDDMLEEEDTDEEDDDGGGTETNAGVESREKQIFKEEFFSSGYNAFLRGQNDDFDYKEVDNNDTLDLLDIQARDAEERYFDEEEELSCHDMDWDEEKRS